MKKEVLLGGLALGSCVIAKTEELRPNVVLVVVDDWGNGDLGTYGVLDDIKTPHLDRLVRDGVLFTNGYITSPQCAPSRAGLLTGRYQQRFGFDSIPDGPLPLTETTVAERLRKAGYRTGHVGKWHLEPNRYTGRWIAGQDPEQIQKAGPDADDLPLEVMLDYLPGQRGFDEFYYRRMSPYWANYDLQGDDLKQSGEWQRTEQFRVNVHTEAALSFIRRNRQDPFFLYLAYFAPHVPLESPRTYLDRFPGDMPERRRYALAMMSAVDDGIGRIIDALEKAGVRKNTLITFISDNGAPLGAYSGAVMEDVRPATQNGPGWDGSRNDPFRGEKGMLSEGGIRVPFIMSWPGMLPAGIEFQEPVISMDITATAIAAAGLPEDPEIDGVNLIPFLTGTNKTKPHKFLYWRFWNQTAIRSEDWKFIQAGSRRFLFHLKDDREEVHNVIVDHPEKANELRQQLKQWSDRLQPAGIPGDMKNKEEIWYDCYFGQDEEGR